MRALGQTDRDASSSAPVFIYFSDPRSESVIIKQLAQSVARQDWFTVCVEILVVVVGIYLGLQASDWSQDRIDRQDELRYLERISADMQASASQTLADVEFQSRHAGYGELILDSVSACNLPRDKRDRFASGIYLAGKYINATFVKASIEELLSSGRTTIIRNLSLRQSIIELLTYYEEHLFYMSDVQLRTTPHVNYIDSVAPIVITEPIGGGADVPWGNLHADFNSLCSDRRFFSAIAATMNYTWDSTASLIQWAERVSSLQNDIDAELEILTGRK
jgi:hypothetical protein